MEGSKMFEFKALVTRHIKIFLRDKTAVFVSFLSVIILLVVYILFVGRSYTQTTDMMPLTDALKTYMLIGQMMGGILVVNTVSLSLGMMGNLINDIEYKRMDALNIAPIKRSYLIFSYLIAAMIVTFVLTLFMWILTIMYVGIFAGYWYSLSTIIIATLYLLLFTFISSTLMIYITTLIKSVNAFGTLAGVFGTVIGFISGIYMPLFVLGKGISYVASFVPFTHMAISLKNILLKEPFELAEAFIEPSVMENIKIAYGVTPIGVLGQDVAFFVIYSAIILLSLGLLFLAMRNMQKKLSNQ
jgi:multidrug/hemolysin transport system permease protein